MSPSPQVGVHLEEGRGLEIIQEKPVSIIPKDDHPSPLLLFPSSHSSPSSISPFPILEQLVAPTSKFTVPAGHTNQLDWFDEDW